jgi:hypothetical protein
MHGDHLLVLELDFDRGTGPSGREIGSATTDARGNTIYRDNMGRDTGRSVTDARGNVTFYDAMGRNTGRSVTNGSTTTTYDNMGRQTGTIRGSK